ncbi:hypothetical protein VTO73DRAFT_1327 [Trametes versicolor]
MKHYSCQFFHNTGLQLSSPRTALATLVGFAITPLLYRARTFINEDQPESRPLVRCRPCSPAQASNDDYNE